MRSLQSLLAHIQTHSSGWRGDLIRHWRDCVGNLADHMSCAKVEGATLYVHVHNSRWMHELYMLTPEIISSILQKVPQAPIRDIRYTYKPRAKRAVAAEYESAEVRDMQPVRLTPRERESLESVADAELRAAILTYRARVVR